MQRLLSKLDQMCKQRAEWEEKFRNQIHKDDITTALVTKGDDNQEVGFHSCCDFPRAFYILLGLGTQVEILF